MKVNVLWANTWVDICGGATGGCQPVRKNIERYEIVN